MTCINKKQTSILAVFSALAIVMTLSPVGLNYNINIAFAGGNDHDDDDGNSASQIIDQVQRSIQNGQVVSGDDIEDSGNNFNFQNQGNSGSNAAGQQGGGDDDDGNNSNQGIGQSQSSRQNSQCVAGGSLGNSCNNISFQNQGNSGSNAAAQSGGDDDDGNNSNQGIGQNQDNEQNAQCVSGEDATVSCNNVSFQNQVNSGYNVLGQD
jgi:hypothetical protein